MHPSRGPHSRFGHPVRVFMDTKMDGSLAAGNAEHPTGSAIVKEMYTEDDKLEGWAVTVKTSMGQGGDGWFWSRTPARPAARPPWQSATEFRFATAATPPARTSCSPITHCNDRTGPIPSCRKDSQGVV